MEMQQVRYFLAVAKTLNFTRAAEQCNVSQPALTRAIKLLEEELGGELIRREGRLSHLTDLGERMLPLLRQCHESALTAKALAESVSKGEIATLSLAVSATLDLALLMPLLAEMFRGFPGIQLKLRRGGARQIAALLKNGEVDLAIGGPLGESWDRLEAWPMFNESFGLVVSRDHELARTNDIELDVDLIREERFLLHSALDASAEDIARLGAAGINIANAHEVDSVEDLEAMVSANFGVAIAPETTLRGVRVRHLQCQALDLHRSVAIYTVAGRPRSREVATLLNLLRGADWTAAIRMPIEQPKPDR